MKWISVLMVFAAIGICAVVYGKDRDGAGATPFAGKVVMVHSATSTAAGIPLVDAKIEKVAGKDFITGVGADSHAEGDWIKGLRFSFALDHVVFINQFTPEEFDKFCKDFGFPHGKQ